MNRSLCEEGKRGRAGERTQTEAHGRQRASCSSGKSASVPGARGAGSDKWWAGTSPWKAFGGRLVTALDFYMHSRAIPNFKVGTSMTVFGR